MSRSRISGSIRLALNRLNGLLNSSDPEVVLRAASELKALARHEERGKKATPRAAQRATEEEIAELEQHLRDVPVYAPGPAARKPARCPYPGCPEPVAAGELACASHSAPKPPRESDIKADPAYATAFNSATGRVEGVDVSEGQRTIGEGVVPGVDGDRFLREVILSAPQTGVEFATYSKDNGWQRVNAEGEPTGESDRQRMIREIRKRESGR